MITVAVATRDPGHSRNYRNLLSQAGFDSHFATDLDDLVRYVKSRPVDFIIFDIAPNSFSATRWLELAGQDKDLGITPILWIGSGIVPSLAALLDSHRPGLRLPRLLDVASLNDVVGVLVGPVPGGSHTTVGEKDAPEDWTPEADSIDGALSMFEELGDQEPLTATGKTPVPETDEVRSIEPASRSAKEKDEPVEKNWLAAAFDAAETVLPGAKQPDGESLVPGQSSGSTPNADDTDSGLDLDVLVMRTGNAKYTRSSGPGHVAPKLHRTDSYTSKAEIPEDTAAHLIQKIADKVTRQLAQELVRNLDPEQIRKAVEAALIPKSHRP